MYLIFACTMFFIGGGMRCSSAELFKPPAFLESAVSSTP